MKVQLGKKVQNMIRGLLEIEEELGTKERSNPRDIYPVKLHRDIRKAVRILNEVEKGLNT